MAATVFVKIEDVLVELFCLVQVYRKKTDEKPCLYSLFSQERHRPKNPTYKLSNLSIHLHMNLYHCSYDVQESVALTPRYARTSPERQNSVPRFRLRKMPKPRTLFLFRVICYVVDVYRILNFGIQLEMVTGLKNGERSLRIVMKLRLKIRTLNFVCVNN